MWRRVIPVNSCTHTMNSWTLAINNTQSTAAHTHTQVHTHMHTLTHTHTHTHTHTLTHTHTYTHTHAYTNDHVYSKPGTRASLNSYHLSSTNSILNSCLRVTHSLMPFGNMEIH